MFKMTLEDNITYAKRNVVDSIYREANIEGITATFPETKEIFEGRAVAGLSVDATIAINNLKHAWEFVFCTLDADIDIMFLRQVNKIVGQGIISTAGEIRNVDVSIGGTEWKPPIPDYDVVKEKYETLSARIGELDGCLELLLNICRDQLFLDGNKRTAQLVANSALIRGGMGVLSIPVSKKAEWEQLLIEYYETGDSGKMKGFLERTSIDGFDSTPVSLP